MGTALIVEDEPRIASLCQRLLARMGMETDIAGTKSQALQALSREGASYVFAYVDVGLPDGSGLDVAEEARRLFPAMPILVATGALEDVRTTAGVVLHKPFTLDAFQSAVTDAMRAVAPREA
jgi:two-component system cell cycle response regulator CpdR